jgi:predicted PurR-regulated permease PerM
MKDRRIITILFFLALLVFLGWLFFDIVVYFFLALVLSIIGSPFVKLLEKISIKGRHLSQTVAAGITLLFIISVISTLLFILVPIISKEISIISSIDPELFTNEIQNWINSVEKILLKYGMIDPNDNLSVILADQFKTVLIKIDVQNLAGNIFSFATSLFIAIFSVTFLTFFSLKDKKIFFTTVEKIIPINYRQSYEKILKASRPPLVRYFSGVFLEMLIMGFLEGVLCFILGIPNPFLIGAIGGLLNVIPYIGPMLGAGVSTILTVTTLLPTHPEGAMLTNSVLKVLFTFGVANLIDNFVLQPVIYGKSVKAHPVEIFVVILMAGHIGGILGMVFAVPAYTLLRIIIKEFFGHYYGVENSLENEIDKS